MENSTDRWAALRSICNHDHDFLNTIRLDRAIGRVRDGMTDKGWGGLQHIKLAILSTSTTGHLTAGVRVAALGRGLMCDIYEPAFGQMRQELADPKSGLHTFAPNVILFAADPYSLFGAAGADTGEASQIAQAAIDDLKTQWHRARDLWNGTIIQQIPFNPFLRLLGENESWFSSSPAFILRTFQEKLRAAAKDEGIDLIDLDYWTSRHGLSAWHSEALWHRSKQEVHPIITPLYGDLVARVIAARYGKAAKCLILDLDNTLWGGVIGDDGLEGIVIGQGSPIGEGYLAFQRYAKQLARRGIILAVCSKNDDEVARRPFRAHPDMALRLDDIGCFIANWSDKATNIRSIARKLNIGIDTCVFADDNPFERQLVRNEIPDVFVPELPEDPSDFSRVIAESGHFESVSLTKEDLAKTEQYQSNARRQALLDQVTDLDEYLSALNMTLKQSAFDEMGLSRIVQLINKTNQFNLTTKRYSEPEVKKLLSDPNVITRQLRLLDKFGDNGIIAVIIGSFAPKSKTLVIDTWLMSCRVLGRQVEQATLDVIVDAAKAIGAGEIIGQYIPTERNGMVEGLFAKLGFSKRPCADPVSSWSLNVNAYEPVRTHIVIEAST
ncbi:HAD-IIIC family phosphatase [Bradyrhizobium sp. CB82]|uniref:HAD-IIIC family phosphatase n=1 Tax=Bradyrhizobium sp. CB82 TaxID=3039159 RepID=UPI0024B0502D|nr:HAD-IIIC family phosphatase [Bradyrhizobium sp. CB82]WFU38846.1 HAD-IIIC family phosphatase [Bradyrhizobium sp. CB82]